MAQLYTHRFMHARGAKVYTSFWVPAGYRAVIRNCASYNSQAGGKYWLQIMRFNVHYFLFPGAGTSEFFETRVVAFEGEEISVYTDIDGTDVWVSGYLFRDDGGLADELVAVERRVGRAPDAPEVDAR